MKRALHDFPVRLTDAPQALNDRPEISFVVGHRGLDRLPHLMATLRSIAGQRGAAVECVVVEQASGREIEKSLPAWVRYLHAPARDAEASYSRALALNAGAEAARGRLVVFHDNDMLCPADYAAEVLARADEGARFIDLKRFLFYVDEEASTRLVAEGILPDAVPLVIQNARGGSVAAAREAFLEIGAFDEAFVGWGGEDLEFWERAETTGRVHDLGYLPFIHLWHAPQAGKVAGRDAPAVLRYYELAGISPVERIRRLRARDPA